MSIVLDNLQFQKSGDKYYVLQNFKKENEVEILLDKIFSHKIPLDKQVQNVRVRKKRDKSIIYFRGTKRNVRILITYLRQFVTIKDKTAIF